MTQNSSESSDVISNGKPVYVFTGNGKGKTTAAVGTAIRAAGHDQKIYISFSNKGEKYTSGETLILSKLPNVKMEVYGAKGWLSRGKASEEQKEQAQKALEAARQALASGEYDLVILDEILMSVYFKLIEADDVLELMRNKPASTSLILTGRGADPKIVREADLVSEILPIKHHYDGGTKAIKGLEF